MKHPTMSQWLQSKIGDKVQKLPVDLGLSCPNRDGTIGWGGCAFCNNRAFTPSYCDSKDSVGEQLEKGKQFFKRKFNGSSYIAYFQSYTNTHGDVDKLISSYEEALAVEGVKGLIIGTRPDCVSDTLLDYFERLSRRTFLLIEYGVESTNDETLKRINRGHTYAVAKSMIKRTAERGIFVGAHLIIGFPWESREDVIQQANDVAALPINTLKLHQLQILRNTPLAEEYQQANWHMLSAEEYADTLADYISLLPESIVLDRFVSQCPPQYVVAPHWGLKATEFEALLNERLAKKKENCIFATQKL